MKRPERSPRRPADSKPGGKAYPGLVTFPGLPERIAHEKITFFYPFYLQKR